jgi:hypothetical protein
VGQIRLQIMRQSGSDFAANQQGDGGVCGNARQLPVNDDEFAKNSPACLLLYEPLSLFFSPILFLFFCVRDSQSIA